MFYAVVTKLANYFCNLRAVAFSTFAYILSSPVALCLSKLVNGFWTHSSLIGGMVKVLPGGSLL